MNDQNHDGWTTVGHDWAVTALQRAVAADSVSHAYLFTGPPGVGRSTLARDLAAALLCEHEIAAHRPCGSCRACRLVAGEHHPDLHLVSSERVGASLKIEQIRELTHRLTLTPVEGRRQVAVLNRFEEATPSAANALLKTLEEPPPYVVLVILAQETDVLLPTIVSRCQRFPLRALPVVDVKRALVGCWDASPEEAELLAHLSSGRLGWAVRRLEDREALARRGACLDDLDRLAQAPLVRRFEYAEKLAKDPVATQETLDLWTSWWRDVLLLVSGSGAHITNVDRDEQLRRYARYLDLATVASMVRALRDTTQRLQRNANKRLTLEVLMLDLPRW